jgi:hypothetical protein
MGNSVFIDGVTFTKITGMTKGSDTVTFEAADGREFIMYHDQDCCENVSIEDVVGDVDDLIGTPIISFECETNTDNPPDDADSFLWTFYKFQTAKGHLTLRWLGESNGYYSESVDFKLSKNGTASWSDPNVSPTLTPSSGPWQRVPEGVAVGDLSLVEMNVSAGGGQNDPQQAWYQARITALEAENKRLVAEVERQREFICKRCYLRTEEGVKPDAPF